VNVPVMSTRRLDGDSTANLVAGSSITAAWHMVLVTMDWSAGDGTLFIDGQTAAQNLSLTSSGTTSNTSSSTGLGLGGYAVASSPTNFCDAEVAELILGNGAVP